MKMRMIKSLVSQELDHAAFTYETGTALGNIDFTTGLVLPIGAMVLGWKAVVSEIFTGDTTAVVQVGTAGDVNKYSANIAQSCLTTGTVGSLALAADSVTGFASAILPRVTVTGGNDWGSITSGKMVVTLYYIDTKDD